MNRSRVEKITKIIPLILSSLITLTGGTAEWAIYTSTETEWHTQWNLRHPCSWGSWSPSPWCVPGKPRGHSNHSRWGECWTCRSTWDGVKSKIKLFIQFPIQPMFILFIDFKTWLIVIISPATLSYKGYLTIEYLIWLPNSYNNNPVKFFYKMQPPSHSVDNTNLLLLLAFRS